VRILFDQGTPVPLRRALAGHDVSTAYELGWSTWKNGDLIAAADASFDVLITTDKNIRHQQNLVRRRLAVVILPTTSWPRIRAHLKDVLATIERAVPGQCLEVSFRDDRSV
jgi:hypothetical protein